MAMTRLPSLLLLLILFVLSFAALPQGNNEDHDDNPTTCNVWFAKSTIPGAGIGLFAGRDFRPREALFPAGDLVLPLLDLEIHQPDYGSIIVHDYPWDGGDLDMNHEAIKAVSAFSLGAGAAANCILDLVNIQETNPTHTEILHRHSDPGAGGFSAYWNRNSIASVDIEAGDELFVSYGEDWFKNRNKTLPPVALRGDMARADRLLHKFESLTKYSGIPKNILQDMWESFAWKNPWNTTSRVLFTVPSTFEGMRATLQTNLKKFYRRQHSTSMEWLEENGICGDWLTVKESTIRQAGRGAFSRKTFQKDEIVAPVPLGHIPYRADLNMFAMDEEDDGAFTRNPTKVVHNQIMLNYCMGHKESTLLLCPYGAFMGYMNHNQTLANVKLVWASPHNTQHHPEWLEKGVGFLDKTKASGLAMNLVALRDIQPGEEVFLDYGDEWEQAWQKHVQNWTPEEGAEDYMSAEQINKQTTDIKTIFEVMEDKSFPDNVDLKFDLAFNRPRHIWFKHWLVGTLEKYVISQEEVWTDCYLMRSETDKDGNTWYTVVIYYKPEEDQPHKIKKPKLIKRVPRSALRYLDQAYSTDAYQVNVFRHDIRLPDHLFPDAWRNRKSVFKKQEEESDGGEL